jgi:hypothetical protein
MAAAVSRGELVHWVWCSDQTTSRTLPADSSLFHAHGERRETRNQFDQVPIAAEIDEVDFDAGGVEALRCRLG